jgi:hypothetical protein
MTCKICVAHYGDNSVGEFELLSMFSISCFIQRLGEFELLSMFSMSCIIQRLGELELLSMFSYYSYLDDVEVKVLILLTSE